ncbi:MAG: hypothetical protein K2N05_10835 [Muribaculaceae bacterium]|nr:hypothetical protein [Muribaculaceae bacterium]
MGEKFSISMLPCNSSMSWYLYGGIACNLLYKLFGKFESNLGILVFLVGVVFESIFLYKFAKGCKPLKRNLYSLFLQIIIGGVILCLTLIHARLSFDTHIVLQSVILIYILAVNIIIAITLEKNFSGYLGAMGRAMWFYPLLMVISGGVAYLGYDFISRIGYGIGVTIMCIGGIGVCLTVILSFVAIPYKMLELLQEGWAHDLTEEEFTKELEELGYYNGLNPSEIPLSSSKMTICTNAQDHNSETTLMEESGLETNKSNLNEGENNSENGVGDTNYPLQSTLDYKLDGTSFSTISNKRKKWYYIWGGAAIIAIGTIIYFACSGLGKGDPVTMTQLHGLWGLNQEENNSYAYSMTYFNARERTFREDFTFSEDGEYICSYRIMGNWSATKDEIRMKYDLESLRFDFNPNLDVEDRKEIRKDVKDEIKKVGIWKEKIISLDSDNLETIDKDGEKSNYFRDYEAD